MKGGLLRIETRLTDRHLGTKQYLAHLPELPEPLPSYNETSQDLIILYAIFRGVRSEPADTELLFRIPSALWSKRSLLLHSDVIERGVPVKFYMETRIWQDKRVRAYMEKQGVTESDIITFDGEDMEVDLPEGSVELYLGKTHFPWVDTRFDTYRFRFMLDIDAFLCRVPKKAGEDRFPLVEKLMEMPEDKLGLAFIGEVLDPGNMPYDWIRTSGMDGDLWFARATEGLGVSISPESVRRVSAMAGLYPTTYLHRQPQFESFLRKVAPVLQTDDCVFSMWHYLTHDVYGVFDAIGLEMAYHEHRVMDFHWDADTKFYLSHVVSMWEDMWRSHIGDPSAEVFGG